jgi:hypothetical protein
MLKDMEGIDHASLRGRRMFFRGTVLALSVVGALLAIKIRVGPGTLGRSSLAVSARSGPSRDCQDDPHFPRPVRHLATDARRVVPYAHRRGGGSPGLYALLGRNGDVDGSAKIRLRNRHICLHSHRPPPCCPPRPTGRCSGPWPPWSQACRLTEGLAVEASRSGARPAALRGATLPSARTRDSFKLFA